MVWYSRPRREPKRRAGEMNGLTKALAAESIATFASIFLSAGAATTCASRRTRSVAAVVQANDHRALDHCDVAQGDGDQRTNRQQLYHPIAPSPVLAYKDRISHRLNRVQFETRSSFCLAPMGRQAGHVRWPHTGDI